MRFAPYAAEAAAMASLSDGERLEYFVTRAVETEEVWGLGADAGWVLREEAETTALPVWPYRSLAADCATGDWDDQVPGAVSLERFVDGILRMLIEQEIQVEIMPNPDAAGFLVHPHRLLELFDGLAEAGEYTLEG